MTTPTPEQPASRNTDREIWREKPDDFYSPSIHVTETGAIGMNVGGRVIVLTIRDWVSIAAGEAVPPPTPARVDELVAGLRDIVAYINHCSEAAKRIYGDSYSLGNSQAATLTAADALERLSRVPVPADVAAMVEGLRTMRADLESLIRHYAANNLEASDLQAKMRTLSLAADALDVLSRERDEVRRDRDRDRLDWLQSVMTPGTGYVEVYLAGLRNGGDWSAKAFQCELSSHYGISGETLRAAIDNCKADAEARLAAGQTTGDGT